MTVVTFAEADAVDLIPIADPPIDLPNGAGVARARLSVFTEDDLDAAGTHGVEPLLPRGPSGLTSATFAGR